MKFETIDWSELSKFKTVQIQFRGIEAFKKENLRCKPNISYKQTINLSELIICIKISSVHAKN